MAIKIQSTLNYHVDGVKCLVYGKAGIGKTVLCSTAPDPFIISTEAGLLSLKGADIPFVDVKSVNDITSIYNFLTTSKEAEKYKTICLDSISEISEVMIIEYKSQEKDARQAYGRMNDDMSSMIRLFRDLPNKHVYFTAKLLKRTEEDTGITDYVPGMPGKTMINALPFFFDELFVMKMGKLEDGTLYRYLQTSPDLQHEAKDRSGELTPRAEPNLTSIFNIIKGEKNAKTT